MRNINSRFLFILTIITFSVNLVTSKTRSVDTTTELIATIGTLEDGDTLLIKNGKYTISALDAPNGLIIATDGFIKYSDVVIMGEGPDKTIIDFDSSYGFLAYKSSNVLIRDLSITNATSNGGIYVDQGELNLDNVWIYSCSAASNLPYKTEGNGGGINYNEGSTFSYIRNCKFNNNKASHKGGAISIDQTTSTTNSDDITIEYSKFYNNSATDQGSALAIYTKTDEILISNNAFWKNTGTNGTIHIDGKKKTQLTNNTITLNEGGLLIATSLYKLCYLDNNSIVDNEKFDVKGESTSTLLNGNYNVCENIINATYSGFYNDDVKYKKAFYSTHNDSLVHNEILARYLMGRISEEASLPKDINQTTRKTPSDIGAYTLPFTDKVAIWTGSHSQDFSVDENWLNGQTPENSSLTIISNCNISTFPIIDSSLEKKADLTNSYLIITPNGILENQGTLITDTFIVESQYGGTGQFLNTGSLTSELKETEFYLSKNLWTPIYISEEKTTAENFLPLLNYDTNYTISTYSQQNGKARILAGSDTIDINKGHNIYLDKVETAIFESFTDTEISFNITKDQGDNTPYAGLNLIGNPFEIALESDLILKNDSNAMGRAIYLFDGTRFKVWVNGAGNSDISDIDPHQSFYVVGKTNNYNLKLNADNAKIKNPVDKSTNEALSSSLVNIMIIDSDNDVLDDMYINIKPNTTETFDYKDDALKLKQLVDIAPMQIYTTDKENIDYALNSVEAIDGKTLSFPVRLSLDSESMASTPLKLKFDITDPEITGCLWHDATKDSSQSIVIGDENTLALNKGNDSTLLNTRYSVEIFNGEVPDSIVRTETRGESGFFNDTIETTLTKSDSIIKDTKSGGYVEIVDGKEYTITIDTIIYEISDSIIDVAYNDTTFIDTTFTDTYNVLGTYHYTTTNYEIEVSSKTRELITYELVTFNVRKDTIITIESKETSALDESNKDNGFKIYTSNGQLIIKADIPTNTNISIYSISGQCIAHKNLPLGEGVLEIPIGNIYIVELETTKQTIKQKIIN